MPTSINHFFCSFVLFKRRQSKSDRLTRSERERGIGWIEEEETPPANPALCALTAALWVFFSGRDFAYSEQTPVFL